MYSDSSSVGRQFLSIQNDFSSLSMMLFVSTSLVLELMRLLFCMYCINCLMSEALISF